MLRSFRSFLTAARIGRFCLFLLLTGFCLTLPRSVDAAARKKKAVAPRKTTRKADKADKAFTIENQGEKPDAWYENAWREFEMGSDKEKKATIAALKKMVKKNPGDALGHYYLGIMLSETGPLKQAEDHLRSALLGYPESDDIMNRLADVLLERGQDEEAFQLLQKVHEINPQNSSALGKLGMKANLEKRYEEAVTLLTQARAAAPEDRQVLFSLGEALSALNRPAEAAEALQACLRLDDSDAEAHWLLGKAYETLGKSADAATELEKAKSLGRKEVDLKNLIGFDLARALNDAGRVEEAIAEYQKTIKVATDPAQGWFELGKVYEDRGKKDLALKAYQKCFEFDDKRSEAQFRVGTLLREDDKLGEAVEAFDVIAKRKDEFGERAQIAIDELREEMHQDLREQLLEIAATGTEEQREDAYFKMLGMDVTNRITFSHPGLRLTIQRYEKIGGMDPNDREALEGLRDLYREKGDLDKVKLYIKKLKTAGHLTKSEADAQLNELEYRVEAGEDLAAWENRLEEFKRHEEWDKALEENKKLKAYALDQLDYWKKFSGDKDLKKAMLKATKARIQTINETAKDLNLSKKRNK